VDAGGGESAGFLIPSIYTLWISSYS
jgi:hypothetical protein